MAEADKQVKDSTRYSVQTEMPEYYGVSLMTGGYGSGYANSIPSIYDAARQAVLARIAMHPQGSMWSGTVSGIIKQVASTSWEVKGKRRVKYFQNVFMDASKGRGFSAFVSSVLWDFFNSDDGAVIEVIGPGDPSTPLARELVTGVGHLQSARCHFTGNQEFPIWYRDAINGKLHKLHHTRVIRLVDNPLSDPQLRGRGMCALSRAISYVQQSIVQQTYIGESMDNKPPPGILIVNGVVQQTWEDAWALYKAGLEQMGARSFLPVVEYINPTTDRVVTVEFVRFSETPDGWDPEKSERSQAFGIARALNIDPQDVLPLTGGSFGTNTQARVLDKKAAGKMIAFVFKELERLFNKFILPEPLKFTFKQRDTEASKEEAELAQAHVSVAQAVSALPGVPADAAVRYLANTVPALADVLLDENGQIRRAYDDDPEEEQETVTDVTAEVDPEQTQTARDDEVLTETKDFEDTRTGFTRDLLAAFESANGGEVNRRRAGVIIRDVLAKYGRKAYLDGLSEGGIDEGVLEGDDYKAYQGWLVEQSAYVTGLTKRIFGTGLSKAQVRGSVDAWANKSLQSAYYLGVKSADQSGLYEFGGANGQEGPCDTCRILMHQRHRMKDWIKRKLVPGVNSENYQCGGWHCSHKLFKVRGKPRGSFLAGKALDSGVWLVAV